MYKAGDKVRIIDNSKSFGGFQVGDIATLVSKEGYESWYLDFKGHDNPQVVLDGMWFAIECRFELVELYKAGDKVRIIDDSHSAGGFKAGDVGRLATRHHDGIWTINIDGDCWSAHECRFELVEVAKTYYSVVAITTSGYSVQLYFGTDADMAESDYAMYSAEKTDRNLNEVVLLKQV